MKMHLAYRAEEGQAGREGVHSLLVVSGDMWPDSARPVPARPEILLSVGLLLSQGSNFNWVSWSWKLFNSAKYALSSELRLGLKTAEHPRVT